MGTCFGLYGHLQNLFSKKGKPSGMGTDTREQFIGKKIN